MVLPTENEGLSSKFIHDSHRPLIPNLPDDLALLCLSKVPRTFHNILKAVCRRWRHCLKLQSFYSLRNASGLTEGWLYVLWRDRMEHLHWNVLDPVKRRWMQLPPMPRKFSWRYGLSCEVLAGKLFVMGGCGKFRDPSNEVICYDPIANSWKEVTPMCTARCYFVTAVLNKMLYAIGGMGFGPGALMSWEVYDLEKDQWSYFDDPNIVADLGESLSCDGNIYVRHVSHGVIPDSYAAVYKSRTNTWVSLDTDMTKVWTGPAISVGSNVYMLDLTYGIKLMVLDKEAMSWNTSGRLSPHAICPPCRIASIETNLYIVGKGLKALVLNLEKIGTESGLLVTSTINGSRSSDDMVVSSNVLAL
ncbi:hypothetical protein O6H91_02G093100 [Diphasiastrum complanatum]|uniref:Uncharacterized protein n=1 Tax=Diphasiastrum complanatum TaxID=34168 RepID=A0ACC2EI37_DIPCM|nr:hypothetical protein O6H91_02G093100 [Diphasiastrum complanatum]